MRHSLRRRLLLGVALSTLFVLVASSLAVYLLMRASLLAEVDSTLGSKARALAALVEQEHEDGEEEVGLEDVPEPARAAILKRAAGRTLTEIERKEEQGRTIYEVELSANGEEIEFRIDAGPLPAGPKGRVRIDLEFEEDAFPEFQRAERPEVLQMWLADGTVLHRSQSLDGRDLALEAGSLASPVCRSVALPDGRAGRAAGITFAPRAEHAPGDETARVTHVVARDTQDMDSTLARLRSLLIGVCALATLVSAGVLVWVVGVGLRPVGQLARQIAGVGEGDLSVRL
ncbi:hypothetical protein HQ560_11640, partial [bacterium]|nr:hypothetical protein [bacterium]